MSLRNVMDLQTVEDEKIDTTSKTQNKQKLKKAVGAKQKSVKTKVSEKDEVKKVGRPATGKRSSDDYRQVTAFIRKDLHQKARRAIIDLEDIEGDIDFSDFLNRALEAYLK